MNFEEVKELISLINNSEIRNFELSLDGGTIKISKNDNAFVSAESRNASESAPVVQEKAAETVVKTEEAPKSTASGGNVVKAPIVGTFYESAGPGKAPFVSVGSKVKKGDVLCIIEAMKIMNEVTSEFDGEVAEIMAENEDLVEFGQPLFRIV